MPTYEYECEKCGKTFEAFQSITAQPLTICQDETCKGKIHRLLSGGAGFLFKGDGFYSTDYRSESYKKGAQAEKKESGTSASGDSKSKSESSSAPISSAKPKSDSASSSAGSKGSGGAPPGASS